jgi:DNA-binding Xre family transcriptional regulator
MPDAIDMKITLAENIQKLAKDSSLRKLAQAAGIPASSLGNWSTGQLPSGEKGHRTLKKLCDYLHCTIDLIMYGDILTPPKQQQTSLSDFLPGDVFAGKFLVDLKIKKLPD